MQSRGHDHYLFYERKGRLFTSALAAKAKFQKELNISTLSVTFLPQPGRSICPTAQV